MLLSRRKLVLFALLVAAPVLVAESSAETFDWPARLQWKQEFVGIESTSVTLAQPRPLRLHALRVDLTAEGIRVCTDDDNGDRPEETDGLRTSSFLKLKQCQVAINGAPFWPGQKEDGGPQNVAGLVISNGKLVSPVDAGDKARAALVFRSGIASIETPPINLSGIETAVGGFGVVRKEGSLFRDLTTPPDVLDGRHPRSAVALADHGKTLFMVTLDGRQPGYSEGVDLAELGALLELLGAEEGLNLDGGGTTVMVLANPKGEPKQVNRPIDGKIEGQERVSASHLGIYAEPLPKTSN